MSAVDTRRTGVRSGIYRQRDTTESNSVVEIDIDLTLEIEYAVVENPKPCRLYPVDITGARHRGKDILGSLHVGHIMTLQRRVYNRLIDTGEVVEPVNKVGF